MLAIREHLPNSDKAQKSVTIDLPHSGFQFDLSLRNQHLINKGFKAPISLKTGTTIAGVVFDGGVVLGADTRATEGYVVADKNCEKIHYLAENMYCCGAGELNICVFRIRAYFAHQLILLRLIRRFPAFLSCGHLNTSHQDFVTPFPICLD